MKKVLLIHHCDGWGGAGISLIYCAKMLSEFLDVTVCLPNSNTELYEKLSDIEGVKIVSLNYEIGMVSAYNGGPSSFSRTFWRNLLRIRESAKKLDDIVKCSKFDIIISNSLTLSWISKYARRRGIKNICYIRETKINNVGFLISKRYISKYSDGVLYISEYDMRSMRIYSRLQAVIEDVACFNDKYDDVYSIKNDKFTVAYLGGNEYIKGFDLVNRLLSDKKLKDISFVIAGTVNNDEKIENSNVKYIGMISDVGNVLGNCDLLIFPANVPHQARPVFEAGAFKIPVIVPQYDVFSENVIDSWNGYYYKPRLYEDLVDKIIMASTNKEINKMGENNFILFKKKHSYESCKVRIERFINSVIQT